MGYHEACCLPGGIEDAMYIDVEEPLDTVRRITIGPTASATGNFRNSWDAYSRAG